MKLGEKIKYIGNLEDSNLQSEGIVIDYKNNQFKCIFNDNIYYLSSDELQKIKNDIKCVKLNQKDYEFLKNNNKLKD